MRRANALVSAHPQMVLEQNFIKVNLGELYLLTNNLDSAQICLDESYRFFSEIQHNSAVYYIETGVSAEYGDKLITLSTCEYSRSNGRLVVVAKKIAD